MRLLGNKNDLAIVETRGLDAISDGREFLVRRVSRLDAPLDEPGLYKVTYGDPPVTPEFVEPIHEHSDLSCRECQGWLGRQTVEHTLTWMYDIFCCPDHPTAQAITDIYPKESVDYGHSDLNAFAGYAVPELPEGVELTADPYDTGQEWPIRSADYYPILKRQAGDNRFLLTPSGIRSDTLLGALGSAARRLVK